MAALAYRRGGPRAGAGRAGRPATPTAKNVRSAATKSGPDCPASETRPRLPVASPVASLTTISTQAARTETRAVRRWGGIVNTVRWGSPRPERSRRAQAGGSRRPRAKPSLKAGRAPPSDAVLKRLRLGQRLELLQGVVLDLADPLAGHAKGAAALLERPRALALEPEPELDHLALAVRQRLERAVDVLAAEVERGGGEGAFGEVVLDEVAEA